MLIGLVKWFDADKGFGVVGTPDEEEYFLHINSFTTKPEKILKGTSIAFSPKIDKAKNRQTMSQKLKILNKIRSAIADLTYLNNIRIVFFPNLWRCRLCKIGHCQDHKCHLACRGPDIGEHL